MKPMLETLVDRSMLNKGLVAALAVILAACGGGGGSAGMTGTAGSGAGGGTTGATPVTTPVTAPVPTPTLRIALFNGASATTSINAAGATTAQATVLDDKNIPVKGKLVTFSGDATLIKFNPPSGTVLTDAVTGIATIQISPISISATGAGVLTASSTIIPSAGGTGVLTSGTVDYQLSAANLTLSGFDVTAGTSLPAYGARTVSVVANVNGSPAVNTPVQVSFSASCGVVSPATVTTDGTGKASSTYTANSTTVPGCAGSNANITASATGATSLVATINVQAAQATNVQFVSAKPQLIYLSGSVGATQSQVVFKLVDSTGSPLQNQTLKLSLTNNAPGVSLGTLGQSQSITLTTDASGTVSAPVFSGSIPTSVQVSAVLASNSTIATNSNVLIVASGVPVQKAVSLSREKFSIEGLSVDGVSTNVMFSLADRQGNPVPVGTSVNFVSSSGVMVPATCVVPARADGTSSSSCSTTIRSQGTRPGNGRVVILAYTPGEEDFIDTNGNNIYDPGEPFVDTGNAFRDDNLNGIFDAGEFNVPRAGTSACGMGVYQRPNTCDGVWGAIDVRDQQIVIFASGSAVLPASQTSLASAVQFTIQDTNGNSMPTGTKIDVVGRPAVAGGTCTATSAPVVVPNQLGPITVTVLPTCAAGDFIDITVTSPLGLVTPFTLRLTP